MEVQWKRPGQCVKRAVVIGPAFVLHVRVQVPHVAWFSRSRKVVSLALHEGLQLVQGVRLNRPSVGLGAVTQEVVLRRLVTLEKELHPCNTSPAEFTPVGLFEITAMPEREVALPGSGASGEGFEVALGLRNRRLVPVHLRTARYGKFKGGS